MKKHLITALIKSFCSHSGWSRKSHDGISGIFENKELSIKIYSLWLWCYRIEFEDPMAIINVYPNNGIKIWLAFKLYSPEKSSIKRREIRLIECIKKLEE